MDKLSFVAVNYDNSDEFINLMHNYVKELDEHLNKSPSAAAVDRWIKSIISHQEEKGWYLEYCLINERKIGFLYGKIDKTEHCGYKKPGYGYIMEFYITPEFRLKGYGKEMFRRIEQLFSEDGAKRMYLTSDPVSGKPFWEKVGFIATGEVSPDNNLLIYEKSIT